MNFTKVNAIGRSGNIVGFAALLIIALVVIACAKTKITVIDNPEMNRTDYRLSPVFADVSSKYVGQYGNTMLKIDIYVPKTSNDTSLYIQTVILSPTKWIVSEGYTLEFSVDGQGLIEKCVEAERFEEKDGVEMGGTAHIASTTYYFCSAWYHADLSILRQIANAESVSFAIHTSNGVVPGRLTQKNLTDIKKFQERYLP